MEVDYDIDEFRQRLEARRPRLRAMILTGVALLAVGLVAAVIFSANLTNTGIALLMLASFCVGGPLVLEGVRSLRELDRGGSFEVVDDPQQKLVVTLAAAPQLPEGTPIPVPFVPRLVAMIVGSIMGMQLTLAIVHLVGVLAAGQGVGDAIVAVGLFAFATYVAVWGSLRRMAPRPEVAAWDGRYAFAVEDDTVIFPVTASRGPQRWPLAETSLSVTKGRLGKTLELSGPDSALRQLPAVRLQLPPARIIELVDSRRTGRPRSRRR